MQTHLRSSLFTAAAFAVFLSLSGCASGPQLENYPRREIDRPYTLPGGVANWQPVLNIQASFIQPSDPFQQSSNVAVNINPLLWQQGLSDDWNLMWLPLPTEVLHQFVKTESDELGFSAGVDSYLYSSNNGFFLSTMAAFFERHIFAKSFALDVVPSFNENIAFKSGQSSTWLASFEIAPLFQVTDDFSLQPGISLSWNHGQITGFLALGSSDLNPTDVTQFTLPLSLTASWSLSRRWDLNASYGYYGIGYDNDFQSHVGTVQGVYYW